MVNKEHCPFFKYGQCIIVSPHIAYSIVNLERCSKYYKTCRYYLKHSGKLSVKSKSSKDFRDRNSSLLQFIDKSETKLVTVGYYSSKNSMKERRRREKLISEVLEMLLRDSQES